MKLADYLVSIQEERVKALVLSRVIDIYKGVYSEYSQNMRSPTSTSCANINEIISCLELLARHIDNIKIVNTVLTVCDILENIAPDYTASNTYKQIQYEINVRMALI